MAAQMSLHIIAGEGITRVATWTNADGSLVNLTGYHANFIATDANTGTVLLNFTDTGQTVGTGCTLTLGGSNGQITFMIPAAALAALPLADYRLLYTNPSGNVRCLVFGQISQEGAVG
jgi:hypothetical protein